MCKGIMGKEFVDAVSHSNKAHEAFGYDILNEKGHAEIEFMLMYLHK